MKDKKKLTIIVLIILLTVILGVIVYWIINKQNNINLEELRVIDEDIMSDRIEQGDISVNNVEIQTEISNKTGDNTEMMAIHITGEIKKAGIVYLKKGSRINDAIKEAGGITKNADLDKINLAYILSDGQKIYIPNKNERNEIKEYIISDSGENILLEKGNNEKSEILKGANQKVNINTAKQTELETLTGIGPSLAQRIMEYRETNGEFQKIEDIKNVKGIGDNKYRNIKDSICI